MRMRMRMNDAGGASADDGSGPAEMVERLYREAGPQLVLAAYALTGNLEDAQDAVHEAFVKAFLRPKKVAGADNPVAWMRTVTLNMARQRHRRRRRLDVLIRRIPPPDEILPDLAPDRIAVLSAIRGLPTAFQEVIALHYLVDMSVEDIATALGVAVGTVKSRLSRGRRLLAGLLGDERPPPGSAGTVPALADTTNGRTR